MAASKHVKALERAGLVRRRISGRTHLCRLEAQPLADAAAWLGLYRRFWIDAFDTLDGLIGSENEAVAATQTLK